MVLWVLHAEERYVVALFSDRFLKRALPAVGFGSEGSFAGNSSCTGASMFGSVSRVPMSVDGLGRKERGEFDRTFPCFHES